MPEKEHASASIVLAGQRITLRWSFRARYRLDKLPTPSFLARPPGIVGAIEEISELIWAMIPQDPNERAVFRKPEDVAEAIGDLPAAQRAEVDAIVSRTVAASLPPPVESANASTGQPEAARAGEPTGTNPSPSPASSSG